MAWFEIAAKILQVVWALIGIWRSGGHEAAKVVLKKQHEQICDEQCQINARIDVTKNGM